MRDVHLLQRIQAAIQNSELNIHLSQPPGIVVITAYEPDPAKWEADLKI